MVSEKECVFYNCLSRAFERDPHSFCYEHSQKEWYTVPEAAQIWNVSDRSVRDWIRSRKLVAAQRKGQRAYLIPAEEFTKPHPSQRLRPLEYVQAVPEQAPRRDRRLTLWPVIIGAAILVLLVASGGTAAVFTGLGNSLMLEDGATGEVPGATTRAELLSVEFESWSPGEPTLIAVGEEVGLEVGFTNTSGVESDFYAAVSLRNPDGDWEDVRPLKRLHLEHGERGVASWSYSVGRKGAWDVVYGIWGSWEEGLEPQNPVDSTGILEDHIMAFQQCGEEPASARLAAIDGYTPFLPVELKVGHTAKISVSFTNTSDRPRSFRAEATPWDTQGDQVPGGSYFTKLDEPLAPGDSATVSWEHLVTSPGSYALQFAIWDASRDRLLVRAPCPAKKLIVASLPMAPAIIGIEPGQPVSNVARQWLNIRGEGFTEGSSVVLSILGNRYIIPEERTEYVSSEMLRVLVGLTDPGTWNVQVTNSEGVESDVFEFIVLP